MDGLLEVLAAVVCGLVVWYVACRIDDYLDKKWREEE